MRWWRDERSSDHLNSNLGGWQQAALVSRQSFEPVLTAAWLCAGALYLAWTFPKLQVSCDNRYFPPVCVVAYKNGPIVLTFREVNGIHVVSLQRAKLCYEKKVLSSQPVKMLLCKV